MTRRNLITGASSGIGLATTRLLVERGEHVIAIARDREHLEEATSNLAGGGTVQCHAIDAADALALADAIGDAPLTMVLASAGLCRQARLDAPDAALVWRQSIAINLDAVFHALRLTAPLLEPGASFIAISSGLGKNARAAYSAYSASKHAVLGLVKCAALELAEKQVRVNAVCPGWVDTPMSAADIVVTAERTGQGSDELRSEIMRSLPLGRPVSAMEVAELVLWLASPKAAAITGQAYNISCGEFFN